MRERRLGESGLTIRKSTASQSASDPDPTGYRVTRRESRDTRHVRDRISAFRAPRMPPPAVAALGHPPPLCLNPRFPGGESTDFPVIRRISPPLVQPRSRCGPRTKGSLLYQGLRADSDPRRRGLRLREGGEKLGVWPLPPDGGGDEEGLGLSHGVGEARSSECSDAEGALSGFTESLCLGEPSIHSRPS